MVCKTTIVCLSVVLLVTASTVIVTVLLKNEVSVVQQEALASSGCIINNLYPDETDCTKFYMCSPYGLQSFKCPSGLLFNPIANYCDWPDIAGCILVTSTTPKSYDEDIFTVLPQDIITIFSGMESGNNEDYLQEITNSKEHLTTSLTDSSSISVNNKQTTLPNEHFSSSLYTSYADSSTVTKEDDITFSDIQDHVTDINNDYVDFATQYLVTQKELFESVQQSESNDSLGELSTKLENFISSHNIYTNSDSEEIVTSDKLFVTKFTTENEKLDKNLNTAEYIIRTTENYVLSQSNFELQNNTFFEFSSTKNPMVNTESSSEFVEEPNVDSFTTHLHTKERIEDIFNSKVTTTFTQQDTISSLTQEKGGSVPLDTHNFVTEINKYPSVAEKGNAEMAFMPNGHDSSTSYSTNMEISEENLVTEQTISAVTNTNEKNFYDISVEPSVVESYVVETNTKPSDYKDTTTFITSETVETEPIDDVTIEEINVNTASTSVSLNTNSITEFLAPTSDLPNIKQIETSTSVTTIFTGPNTSDAEVNIITLSNSNLDIDDKKATSISSESLASYTERSLNKNITASELILSTNENNNEQFSTISQVEIYETDQLEITTEHSLTTTISEYNLDALNTFPEMNPVTEGGYLLKSSSADNNFIDIQYHDKLLTVLGENSVTQEVNKILSSASTESSGISNKDIPTLITNTELSEQTTLTVTSPYTGSASVLYFSDGVTPNELISGSSISNSEIVNNPTIASSHVSLEVDNVVSNPSKVSNIPSKGDTTTTDKNKSATESYFDENFKLESIFDNTLSHVETPSQNDSDAQHLDITVTTTDVSSTNELKETTNDNILGVTSNNLVVTEQKTSSVNFSEHMHTTELSVHEATISSNHELDIQTDVEGSSKNSIITTSSNLMVTKISFSTEKPTEINGLSNNVVDHDLIYNEIDESGTVSTEAMFTQNSDSAVSSKLNKIENEINIVFTESVTSDPSTFRLNESNGSSLEYNLTQDITTESTANLSYSIKVIITVTAQDSFSSNSTLTEDDSISNIIEDFIDNGLETIKDFSEVASNDVFNSYTETADNVEENDNDEDNDNDDGGDDDEEQYNENGDEDDDEDGDNNVDVNNDGDGKGKENGNENADNKNGEEHQHHNSHKHLYDEDRDYKNKNHEDNIVGYKKENRYHNNHKHKHRGNNSKEIYKLDYNSDLNNGNNNRHNQKDMIKSNNNESEKKNIKLIQNRHHESTRRESNRRNKQENIEMFYKVIGKIKKTVNWF